MTTRVFPPPSGVTTSRINKAVYTASPGQFLDVPDADATALATLGWSVIGSVGSTQARQSTVVPTAPAHFDTTINQLVYHDGLNYRTSTAKKI